MGMKPDDSDYHQFVEFDPTGRYGRYNEILGKGASKIVYRAFDEYEGIEVAWNQVKLYDFLQSPDDLERLYCEIHLLKTLKHKNIMKFYTSWVDISNRNINFVTEMFTSGTLRQYRQKHKNANIRAVKNWCRQILMGLHYLHSHDPPVIHRDLKCDNIFVNGNQGEVKIGDLGLAAILRKSHAVHCVGTPEFMAPEVFEEEYNELVDIYSFGMCILEMVTYEYPYSECTHPAQIYKKVSSGTKPDALYRVKDPEVRHFVEKCLATASRRLSAKELLMDPFLQIDDCGSGSCEEEIVGMESILRQPSYIPTYSNHSSVSDGFYNDVPYETDNECGYNSADSRMDEIEFFNSHEDESLVNLDITIKGRKGEDGGIFFRLRVSDKEGHVRNIYFSFDIKADTALGVATEMVAELDITDYDVTRIADMIDGEISALLPEWNPGPDTEEEIFKSNYATNDASCSSLLKYLSASNSCCTYLESADETPPPECGGMHARYEEIIYHGKGSKQREAKVVPVKNNSWRRKTLGEEEYLKMSFKLRDDQHSRGKRAFNSSPDFEKILLEDKTTHSSVNKRMMSFHLGTKFSFRLPNDTTDDCWNRSPESEIQRALDCVANSSSSPESPSSFYAGRAPQQRCLLRTKSLPANAVDV